MIKFPPLFDSDNIQAHNLFRLFMLRNFLIAGASAFILYATYHQIALPFIPIGIILSVLIFINLITGWRLYFKKNISDNTLIWQLIIDVATFTAILYFTGGASNPFGWFYLVPIFITATLLRGRAIWLITALSIIGYTTLVFFNQPLGSASAHNMQNMHNNDGFQQHVMGMWLGYIFTALLVSYVVSRMANSLREQNNHLVQAREKALRDERLVALGTLAAGTAHELGTPLSTIAIVVKELQTLSNSTETTKYLKIIREQVDRCKQALTTLSHSAGEELMSSGEILPVKQYILNIIEQWQSQRPETKLNLISDLSILDAKILSEQTMTQALINIINNAADASPEKISLQVVQSDNKITISIMDNGPGLDTMIQHHAGKQTFSRKSHGLGLGLFLAHASIERLGGKIFLANQTQGGAVVKVTLPLTEQFTEINHAD